jgi:hypothetical protein
MYPFGNRLVRLHRECVRFYPQGPPGKMTGSDD